MRAGRNRHDCLVRQEARSVVYRRIGKRIVDVVLASGALAVLSPLMLGVAAMVRFKLGRPVLFRQARPGLNGEVFEMFKFRTMTDERDATGDLLPDSERLTAFGRTLRSTSLDELPELINVVKGDMSLVGPRPLRTYYLPLYNATQARRHEVRPGITGLAQVSGRNNLTWESKFELDVAYVDRLSPLLDMQIILKTIGSVLGRRGVSAPGEATMPPFRGSLSGEGTS